LQQPRGSLRADGSRDWVHPADVKGVWTTRRRIVFGVLIAIYVVLPWISIGGHPAVFLDIGDRQFFLFGATFNAQDAWLAFFLITGVGFLLLVLAAVLGRAWCGYACPQTVFLEGVYRRVERLVEGPRATRLRRNAGPWTADRLWRKGLKHGIFVALSLLLAHVFLSYFTSLPELFEMVRRRPSEHPEAFAWVMGISAALYLNFAFFREQLCLIVCPYGRLQSVLADRDSIVVGYDSKRGEPRGKVRDPDAGDCVDCKRCVVVCPTGIDIRHGLQLDCIGCANCIDACDEVMDKLGREPGLVRYDSQAGLEGAETRFMRPRLLFYAVLGVLGLVVASFAMRSRTGFEANMLRMRGAPFVLTDDGSVRNSYEIHVVNKGDTPASFELEPRTDGLTFQISRPELELDAMGETTVPVFVTAPRTDVGANQSVRIRVTMDDGERESKDIEAPFLGPRR
jgi:cytochrome c oxidase accessory protein FixG